MSPTAAAPELVGDEDDPPLQQDGGEDLQQPADAQALQQAVKVHVLQPRVHRAAQRQLLLDERTGGGVGGVRVCLHSRLVHTGVSGFCCNVLSVAVLSSLLLLLLLLGLSENHLRFTV